MMRCVTCPVHRDGPVPNRLARVLCLVVALPLTTGCYGYVPVDFAALSPPEQVQARLTPGGTERFSELFGSPETVIQGELLEVSPAGVTMTVSTGRLQEGFHFQTLHQELLLPREQILVVERRKLDAFRTAGAGVLVAAVAGLVIQKLVQDNRDQRAPTPPPVPGEVWVPALPRGMR